MPRVRGGYSATPAADDPVGIIWADYDGVFVKPLVETGKIVQAPSGTDWGGDFMHRVLGGFGNAVHRNLTDGPD